MKSASGSIFQVMDARNDMHGVISRNDRYISLPDYKLTWMEAKEFCETNYGTSLASIHSIRDEKELIELVKALDQYEKDLDQIGNFGNIWIGLKKNREDGWTWIDNDGMITYSNWCNNEPNWGLSDSLSAEDCGSYVVENECWASEECLNLKQIFVCNYLPTLQG